MPEEVNETNEDTQEVTQPEVPEIKDPKAVLEALERAKADAKKYREQAEALEAEKQQMVDRISALEGDEGIALWKNRAVELATKQQLAKSGVADPDRIYGFMDASTLDYDDEGRVTGFDEAVKAVKEKLPELFDNKRRVAGGADLFESEKPRRELSGTEAQVQRIFSKQ